MLENLLLLCCLTHLWRQSWALRLCKSEQIPRYPFPVTCQQCVWNHNREIEIRDGLVCFPKPLTAESGMSRYGQALFSTGRCKRKDLRAGRPEQHVNLKVLQHIRDNKSFANGNHSKICVCPLGPMPVLPGHISTGQSRAGQRWCFTGRSSLFFWHGMARPHPWQKSWNINLETLGGPPDSLPCSLLSPHHLLRRLRPVQLSGFAANHHTITLSIPRTPWYGLRKESQK